MIKRILILFSLAIMLTAVGKEFSIHMVYAESFSDLHNQDDLTQVKQAAIQTRPLTAEPAIPNHQGKFVSINEQMKRVSEAIQENNLAIQKTDREAYAAKLEVEKLEQEVLILKDSIDKRTQVLKQRALSYQQSEKHAGYLDVLLGSTSLSDFVDRVGAVAAIAEADRNLLEQQESQQREYDNKKLSLEKKLTALASMRKNLEIMQAHLTKQQKEYVVLKEKLDQASRKKEIAHTNIEPIPKVKNKYISTVTTAGNKYIGNSVYVFGGGRNARDIAQGRFDCSGFVHWAFAQAGIEIGSHTDSIKKDGRQVSPQEMQPGDLVFFDTYKRDGHVGIYLGNGKFIGSQSSTGVAIADMTKGYWKNTFKGRVIRI
ncbi:NlpC/P60 family protein [Neobacillus sp. NPDC058068]|uniref:C40 family peptidase n=1 Tax=Neobacillus sp. NPDC058068 TaxID=3346325 RepID=UPI0036DE505F